MYTITGSWGGFTTDEEGNILTRKEEADEDNGTVPYCDIAKFDIKEYLEWANSVSVPYPKESELHPANHRHLDICDVGYWATSGYYEPAVEDFRQRYIEECNDAENRT